MFRPQHQLAVAGQHVKQTMFALQEYTVSAWYQYSDTSIYTMALSTVLVALLIAVCATLFLWFLSFFVSKVSVWHLTVCGRASLCSLSCFSWTVAILYNTWLLFSLYSCMTMMTTMQKKFFGLQWFLFLVILGWNKGCSNSVSHLDILFNLVENWFHISTVGKAKCTELIVPSKNCWLELPKLGF